MVIVLILIIAIAFEANILLKDSSSAEKSRSAAYPFPFCERNSSAEQCLGTWKPDSAKGECGRTLTATSIVSGEDAKIGDFPYVALLLTQYGPDQFYASCGGSVINAWYVMTAAHCVDPVVWNVTNLE